MKTIALLTFIAVYALLLLLPKYRAVSALSAAALFLLLRIVPLGDVAGTVDWNVLATTEVKLAITRIRTSSAKMTNSL